MHAIACTAGVLAFSRLAAGENTAGFSFFEEKIRPVLAERCYNCHSARATKIKGGLTLDTKESAFKGGKSGLAIKPGDPESSPLIKAIKRADADSAMPPDDKEKLSAASIADFEKWIKLGAPYPEGAAADLLKEPKPWWDAIPEAQLLSPKRSINEAVDHYIAAKLKESGIAPAPQVPDWNFIRRVTLDLAGRIPTQAEVSAYESARDSDKKQRLVDTLLASPSFARQQVTELNWLLMDGRDGAFREYLAKAVKENKSWDTIFREVLAADPVATKGCEQFLKQRLKDADRMATDVSMRFFGVNISCAQCHNHPHVPGWTQDRYYGMKGFFSRTFEVGEFVAERDYGYVSYKPLKADTTRRVPLIFINGETIAEPEAAEPNDAAKKAEQKLIDDAKKEKKALPAPKFSRRAKLVEVSLASGQDGYFARAIVNQIWSRLFGQGLVMPVDQMHGQNKPSHPELLVWLARDLIRQKYDVRALLRGLVLSEAYARSSEWSGPERPDPRLLAAASPRALTPQQFGASLQIATTAPSAFAKDSAAALERMEKEGQSWIGLFERPSFDFQVSVEEALLFSNSDKAAKQLLADGDDKLIKQLLSIDSHAALLRTAFTNILARQPQPQELALMEDFLQKRTDQRSDAVKDVMWALLASTEFRFNH